MYLNVLRFHQKILAFEVELKPLDFPIIQGSSKIQVLSILSPQLIYMSMSLSAYGIEIREDRFEAAMTQPVI